MEESSTTTNTGTVSSEQQQQEKILQYLQNTYSEVTDVGSDPDELKPEIYDLEWLENLSKQLQITVKQNSDIRIKYSSDPLK